MQAPFPHYYMIKLDSMQKGSGTLSDTQKPQIIIGPPPEFGGKAQFWSPEELLLGSVTACTMTTFFALVEKNPIDILSYTSSIEGILNKTKSGIVFERIVLQVTLQVNDSDVEEATRLIYAAKKYCIITNSLNVVVDFNPVVIGAEERRYSEAV